MSTKAIKGVRLSFTRTFTRGLFENMTHNDSLWFTSKTRALQWVRAVNANNRKGEVDYRVKVDGIESGVDGLERFR